MIGALLFVLSDSLLALNKFYQSFEFASVAIILAYALAQFFIVKGEVDYFNSASKEQLCFDKHPRLGGANLMKHFALVNWGGLLSSERNVQECDTTDDAMKN